MDVVMTIRAESDQVFYAMAITGDVISPAISPEERGELK